MNKYVDNYEINEDTMLLLPLGENLCHIIEYNDEFTVKLGSNEIIDYSCKYYGSSYIGRYEGTKAILGYSYKLPIVIDEVKNVIFFPTCSPRYGKACWINPKYVKKFIQKERKTTIIFTNEKTILLDISYRSFENQILRATYLENTLRNRRK